MAVSGFWVLQVVTVGILVLAANTAYQDFPRLSAILARHKLMPRQFRNLGDRLVFSNGIIALAVVASLLIIAFEAEVTRLIQLYVVGVFIDFTLSQFGMVRRWIELKPPNWRRYAFISGLGALTCRGPGGDRIGEIQPWRLDRAHRHPDAGGVDGVNPTALPQRRRPASTRPDHPGLTDAQQGGGAGLTSRRHHQGLQLRRHDRRRGGAGSM